MDRNDKGFAIFAVCAIVALLAVAGVNLYQTRNDAPGVSTVPYSQFLDDIDGGKVSKVVIAGHKIAGQLSNGKYIRTYSAGDDDKADGDLIKALRAKGVAITAEKAPTDGPTWLQVVITLLATVLFMGLSYFFMRGFPGMNPGGKGGTGAMGLGKSKARRLTEAHGRVTFADVAGVDEAKEGLQEIVDFLREPQAFQRLGGRIPRGVLLVGPPGSGKTLLARAIAGEAGVPFFTISGSDFVEMFVGVGASRVRDMFAEAKKNAPCIVFMDEIDAVGRKRGAGVGGGNDEREQTLNQLLVEMDGFESNEGVILIAATNRPDVLDPALLRPGRFDREIVVANPDVGGREHILSVHVRRVPLADDVDLKVVARRTPGFSGADLANLVNEAALLAARRGMSQIGRREFEDARDTVTMGAERRTHVMTDEEKRLTAYREGGRAIVALHAPWADPVHKATIIPRGRSMGMVKQLPEDDQASITRRQMTSKLAIMLSGRAAEELIFGPDQVTSGTAGDLEQATKLARDMVTRYGLSDALGTVAYGENQDEVFLGNSVTRTQNVSEETAQLIAVEVRKLIDAGLADARTILTERKGELETVAQGLLKYETLSGEEIRDLLAGRLPVRNLDNDEPAPEAQPEA